MFTSKLRVVLFVLATLSVAMTALASGLTNLAGQQHNGKSTAVETFSDWVSIPDGGTVTVPMLPLPAALPGEHFDIWALGSAEMLDASACGETGNCDAWWSRTWHPTKRGSIFVSPLNATSDTDNGHEIGGFLDGSTMTLVQSGATIAAQITCTQPCGIGLSASLNRRQAPNGLDAGPGAVVSVSPNVFATTYGSTPMPFTITTSGVGFTHVSVGGVDITSTCSGVGGSLSCGLPANSSWLAGGQTVAVTTTGGILTPLSGGITFVQSAITSITPSSGSTTGGTSVTIAFNAGATNGCTTPPTTAGFAITGCSVTNDQTITGVTAAGTGTGNVHATSPSSPTDLVNGWSYAAVPTLLATGYPRATARGGASFPFKGTNFVAGCTCNFGSTTGVATTITDSSHASCNVPAGTATGTETTFSVTCGGNTTATKPFGYYPNSVIEMHVPGVAIDTGFPASPGQTVSSWADVSGANKCSSGTAPCPFTQATGANQLTVASSWTSSGATNFNPAGWSAYNNASGAHYMVSALPSQSQPIGIVVVADATTATDSFLGFLVSGTTSGGRNDIFNDNTSTCGAGKRLAFIAGAANEACLTTAYNISTVASGGRGPGSIGGLFNGQTVNSSLFWGDAVQIANSNGSSVGSNPLVGVTIFAKYDLSTPWVGNMGEILILGGGASAATIQSDITTIIQPLQKQPSAWGTGL